MGPAGVRLFVETTGWLTARAAVYRIDAAE
jgi:hypothetical protein